jgi:hypothetical protein
MRAILSFRSLANAMYTMSARLTGLHRKPQSVFKVETFGLLLAQQALLEVENMPDMDSRRAISGSSVDQNWIVEDCGIVH